jgi:hypothetical protein
MQTEEANEKLHVVSQDKPIFLRVSASRVALL